MSEKIHTVQEYWDERSELFGNYYLQPSWFDRTFRKAVYTREAVAVKTCKRVNNATVLDIGSGPGVNSLAIVKNAKPKHVLGIDFASNMIAYSKELFKNEGLQDAASFIEGDFTTYDFQGQRFDVSIALGVLDYIEDSDMFMNRMIGLTDKFAVISWPENGFRMSLRKFRYTCPLFHYTEDRIKQLHFNNGIDKEKLEVINVPGGWVTVAEK